MRKINKRLYLGWIIAGLAGIILFYAGALGIYVSIMGSYAGDVTAWMAVSIAVLTAGGILTVTGIVFCCLLLYKAWKAIQNGRARTTPGKAVGFLFIPLFNLYWNFIAYWGFARDYNSYLQHKSMNSPKLAEGLFLCYPILALCIMLPLAGYLSGLAAMAVFAIISSRMIDAVNELCTAVNTTAQTA